MKYFSCLFLLVLFSGMNAFSQEKYTRHTVSRGETISEIAEHYNVKAKAIYQLNPKAKKGIQYRAVLLIPTKAKKTKASVSDIVTNHSEKTHVVLAKETLYGIAKQYNISVDDLYKINPELEKEGLKKGQTIKIFHTNSENLALNAKPEKLNTSDKNIPNEQVIVSAKSDNIVENQIEGVTHEVLPKETLYSIAKKNGITITDLKKANPSFENKPLKAGQKIIVPVKMDAKSNLVAQTEIIKSDNGLNPVSAYEQAKQGTALSQTQADVNKVETEINREVLPKETKYGIAKEYGITVAELEKQNPSIAKKLLVGSVLKIRTSKGIEEKNPVEEVVVAEQVVNEDSNRITNTIRDNDFVDQLISKASENIGTRYRSGGTTTKGFDCSGLMFYTFSSYDIKLPRSSIEMASYGSKIDSQNAQKGDLIFFRTRGSGRINHVGMVVEVLDGEIKFIHSATHGGVIISSTKESYYERNLAQINRVL